MIAEPLLPSNNNDKEEVIALLTEDPEAVGYDTHQEYVSIVDQQSTIRSSHWTSKKIVIVSVLALAAIVAVIVVNTQQQQPAAAGNSSPITTTSHEIEVISVDNSQLVSPVTPIDEANMPISTPQTLLEQPILPRYDDEEEKPVAKMQTQEVAYEGEYESEYEYGSPMNFNDNGEYGGEYEYEVSPLQFDDTMEYEYSGEHHHAQGMRTHEDYAMKGSQQQQQRQWINRKQGQQSSGRCETLGDSMLLVKGINQDARCVQRVDTKEVGVLFDGEALFSRVSSENMNELEFVVYLIYNENDNSCSVEMDRVNCL